MSVVLHPEACTTCKHDVLCVRTATGDHVIVDADPSKSAGTVMVHLGAARPSAAVLTSTEARRRRSTGQTLYAMHDLSCSNPAIGITRRPQR